MENILKPLAKSFPIPLGLTVGAAAATDAVIQKKKLSCMITLANSNGNG